MIKKIKCLLIMILPMMFSTSIMASTDNEHYTRLMLNGVFVSCSSGGNYIIEKGGVVNDFCSICGEEYPFKTEIQKAFDTNKLAEIFANTLLYNATTERYTIDKPESEFSAVNDISGETVGHSTRLKEKITVDMLINDINKLLDGMGEIMGNLGFLTGVLLFLMLFTWLIPVRLWIAALASNVHVSVLTLIGMRFRGVKPHKIIMPMIKAHKAGLKVTINELETHYLAGGDVSNVVDAIIAAERAEIDLPFKRAAAIDLAGRNVLEAVQMSVNPKVIITSNVSAMSKDGIELIVDANVTVRANLDRLVGGAGEDTVLARVGEGIVTTVGSATSHKEVLENPDIISKAVLDKGLDKGTAYEILSIDIADIDIGRNIGADLQIKQAEADKQIAQAKAEERRAMAIAKEQEMKAAVVEAQAEVVRAESKVPLALAKTLESGGMSPKEYYDLKNLTADTDMRASVAKVVKEENCLGRDDKDGEED